MVAELPLSPAELAAGWIGSLTGTWWFACTSPRLVERLARDLEAAGATALNLKATHVVCRETVSNGQKRRYRDTVRIPLFPGYLFFNGGVEHRLIAKEGPVKPQVHDVRDQEKLARELAQLVRTIAVCPNLGIAKLQRGQEVRVVAGPLIGMSGYIIESRPAVLHLAIHELRYAGVTEIDPSMVEPI